jgi:hypothetical protein
MTTIGNEQEDTSRAAFAGVVAIVAGAAIVLFAYGAITVPPPPQHSGAPSTMSDSASSKPQHH